MANNSLFHSLLMPTTLALVLLLHLSKPSQAQTSFISASPSILPSVPSTSSSSSSSIPPALPPDLMPLFPTPKHGGAAASPPESDVLPTIPSSPSPPNPDNINSNTPEDDEPHSAIAPIGSQPLSSAGNLVNLWGGFFCVLLLVVPIMC